jgi:hypothetical protein
MNIKKAGQQPGFFVLLQFYFFQVIAKKFVGAEYMLYYP